MKNLIAFLVIAIAGMQVSAQSLSGLLKESDTSAPIARAIVTIEDTPFAQTSDKDGKFLFTNKLQDGEYVVTAEKDGYETAYFLIELINGKGVQANVKMDVTKKERKRRKKIKNSLDKDEKNEEKEKEKKLKAAQKEKEEKEKELEKRKKKLQKANKKKKKEADVIIIDVPNEQEVISKPLLASNTSEPIITAIQEKYASIIGIPPTELSNVDLYEFIDEWYGTPYLLGGANKSGIDCSSFTQRIFTEVYDDYIERTAEKQFKSAYTDKFSGISYLEEGDLIFFKGAGQLESSITHVGFYLGNDMFVHSTARRGSSGQSGVKISNLKDSFWLSRFVSAGRRIKNN